MNIKRQQDLKRLILLIIAASVIGVLQIASTCLTSKDGVSWIEKAQRIDSTESVSGRDGLSGQKYLFWPASGGIDAIMGISVGINGIAVYEHGANYMPALAVYEGNLGTGWNHIAVTYTDKQPRIYLNGILVRTGKISLKANVFAPTCLGGGAYGYFKGSVSNVKIWGSVLSSAAIMADAAGDSDEGGLMGRWKLAEGSGLTAYDDSGHNHNAVVNGAVQRPYGSGYALLFDGIDDTVTLNYPKITNNFTISAWVQPVESIKIKTPTARFAEIQDPGYPLLLSLWQKFLGHFWIGRSNLDWILASQTLTLLCQILAIVPLYFLGKQLVGQRYAFVSLLILLFLPWPAKFACDILREWPNMLFLSAGLLAIAVAFSCRGVVFFLHAGLIAGLGHIIRPECAQIVLYAVMGLIISFIWQDKWFSRKQTIHGLVLMLLGFGVIYVPYAHMQGKILPIKLKQILSPKDTAGFPLSAVPIETPQIAGIDTVPFKAIITIIDGISENQMYYFFPFMVIGLCLFLKKEHSYSFHKLLITGFIIFNFMMYVALYYRWGYVSRRHTLPLAAMTLFFVPLGLETATGLLSKYNPISNGPVDMKKSKSLFWVLTLVGILICLPKLMSPIGYDKSGFRKAAEYIRHNTPHDALIAVPDRRIAFYAERNSVTFDMQLANSRWDYMVIIEKKNKADGSQQAVPPRAKVYVEPLNKSSLCSQEVVVYRREDLLGDKEAVGSGKKM